MSIWYFLMTVETITFIYFINTSRIHHLTIGMGVPFNRICVTVKVWFYYIKDNLLSMTRKLIMQKTIILIKQFLLVLLYFHSSGKTWKIFITFANIRQFTTQLDYGDFLWYIYIELISFSMGILQILVFSSNVKYFMLPINDNIDLQ